MAQLNIVGDAPPPVAGAVAQQAFQDPATREVMKQHAMELGGHAALMAKHYGHKGVMAFGDYIQQGPKGASTLCFIGGVGSSIAGGLCVSGFFNAVTDPLHYVLYVYMFMFGLATTCLEADPDRIGMMPTPFDMLAGPLTRGQAWLHSEVKLLTELRGRGVFYLYQGTLMCTQWSLLLFIVGAYSVLMGILCIAMSFGIQPDFDRLAAQTGFPGEVQYNQITDEEAANLKANNPNYGNSPTASYHQQYYSNFTNQTLTNALPASIDADFNAATEALTKGKEKLSGKASRALWALQQQATTGDCNTKKPTGMFNGNAKEQWRLWNELKGIACEDAKVMFVERLRKEKIGG